ncbi:hypothetical protein KQX54_010605 [Cotesia glomerata]|uniref:Uncharacterized protein n=1 Tax=Cotesia glomerata TaxID=32391 RepID=A0AAV7J2V9_COTGL|nr:hypothetical protein KQX54_010605 [Cotesia glomerata]
MVNMDKTHGVGCLNPWNGQTDGWSSSLYARDEEEEEEAEGNSRDKFTRLCSDPKSAKGGIARASRHRRYVESRGRPGKTPTDCDSRLVVSYPILSWLMLYMLG